MIQIPKEIIQKIFEHAHKEKPLEACGYLAGKDTKVQMVFSMTNADQSTDHFSLDPKEQFAVLKEARTMGLELLAVYHSHPITPARPSEEDLKLAFDPGISYVIASLLDDSIKSFRIHSHRPEPEALEII